MACVGLHKMNAASTVSRLPLVAHCRTDTSADAASRKVVISNLELFSRPAESGYTRSFCNVAAKLVERLGATDAALYPCFEAASEIAFAIDRHAPSIFPPSDDDLGLEHPEFRRVHRVTSHASPKAEQWTTWP